MLNDFFSIFSGETETFSNEISVQAGPGAEGAVEGQRCWTLRARVVGHRRLGAGDEGVGRQVSDTSTRLWPGAAERPWPAVRARGQERR